MINDTKQQINNLRNEGLEDYLDNEAFMQFWDEKDPYREYKDQEVKSLNSK